MLEQNQNSIVLLHGFFQNDFFDEIKKKNPPDVFVLEGRPDLKSSQLMIDELAKRNIFPTLISDNMAGFLFYKNLVKEVWLSFQSISDDGALCPIGALILGVLGKKHNIPVYLYPADGNQRKLLAAEDEILSFKGKRIASPGVKAYVPLVEWLSKKYITKMYTLDSSLTI